MRYRNAVCHLAVGAPGPCTYYLVVPRWVGRLPDNWEVMAITDSLAALPAILSRLRPRGPASIYTGFFERGEDPLNPDKLTLWRHP